MQFLNASQVSLVSGGGFSDELSNYSDAAKEIFKKEWHETTNTQLAVAGVVGGAMALFGRSGVPFAVRAFAPVAVWAITCILKDEPYNVF